MPTIFQRNLKAMYLEIYLKIATINSTIHAQMYKVRYG